MRIVLLATAGATAVDVASVLGEAGPHATVTTIGYAATTADGVTESIVVANTARRRPASPLARIATRLSPWDEGRVFARAVKRSAPARAALNDAELIVACDRDTILAAWNQVHERGSSAFAARGIGAAIAHLRARGR